MCIDQRHASLRRPGTANEQNAYVNFLDLSTPGFNLTTQQILCESRLTPRFCG